MINSLITDFNRHLKNTSLIVPDHISWSINNVNFGEISNTSGTAFKFNYTCGLKNNNPVKFKTAVRNTIKNLYEKSQMTLAICVGGADSEIIAREAKAVGIPFEIYFLNLWDINLVSQTKVLRLAEELNVKCNVIFLSKEVAFNDVIPANYAMLQADKPTYLCLPYLFEQIPESMLIVCGEGDPQKSGPSYEPFANTDGSYSGLPISITEVFYRQWALINNRACEAYFYASTPEMIHAYLNHPLLSNSNKCINTRTLVDSEYGNLLFKYKTTNWEDIEKENYKIRMFVNGINSENKFLRQPLVCLIS